MHDPLLERTVHELRQAMQSKARATPNRSKRSVGLPEAFWPNAKTLRVSFLGTPDPALRQRIFDIGQQWLAYANLSFLLLDNDQPEADIVIRTDAPQHLNQSDYGRYRSDPAGETMTLGVKPSDPDFTAKVLHEFGHALGLYHEHQHPDAAIRWDYEGLRNHISARFTDAQRCAPGFDDTLARLIRQNYEPMTYQPRITLRYDSRSIMHYPVNRSHAFSEHSTTWNQTLSAKDKQFVGMIYPGRYAVDN
ncbi:hypothetical protein KSS93_23525 [Pseudomonas xanthosomatis]|uniref:hypothetical protein n=1 Tax=Pseudomonas xanthosomatis TaxID=2842356 RepID=UPI001C3C236C|nr:hypothetical protein [Pseudomonas xanthosomatis]QXH45809.1 hypothetical protein KSS93_23525 [Pseudomonas xanthosomatis]